MHLSGPAHQQVESQGCGGPDDPGNQVAVELERRGEEGRRSRRGEDERKQDAVERDRKQAARRAIGGVADSGQAVEHHTRSMSSRPNRPYGLMMTVSRMTREAITSRVPETPSRSR